MGAPAGNLAWNQSRTEEISASADVRALAEGGPLPNTSITQLVDVDNSVAPLNDQALTWDDVQKLWIPKTLTSSSGLLKPDDPVTVGAAEEASQQVALAAVPAINSLMISVNGVDQINGTDYTLLVNVVTFTDPNTIKQGDRVMAKYQ